MTICYFGDYDPNYARNRVLIKGLKENGVKILECRSQNCGLAKYWELHKKHQTLEDNYDILIVGQSFKSRLVWLAKLLSNKKIVWDAFYSFYDKYVFDSGLISPKSLKAGYYWRTEKLACRWADLILLDANEHIKYFSCEFGVPESRFVRVLVGTDIETGKMPSAEKKEGVFLVHFHGKYIPLQGVKYIIEAAKILQEKDAAIRFNLIGSGQTYADDRRLADDLGVKNINFIGRVAFGQLPKFIQEADICLGLFGNTPKTQRVIANKVYEAIAMAKPVISADTPAARELFENGKNILFCRRADPDDLAEKILELKNNSQLRNKIAQGAHDLFKSKATPRIIAKDLIDKLNQIVC